MGCSCRGSASAENYTNEGTGLTKKRGCTDLIFLIIFLAFCGGMGYTGYITWETGDPYAILYGRDSWGNTCNRENEPITDATHSGQDLRGISKLFYFNPLSLMNQNLASSSAVLCVKACPNGTISDVADMQAFANDHQSKLCRYDVAVGSYYDGSSDGSDSCPSVPIMENIDILNRCTPKHLVSLANVGVDAAIASADTVSSLVQPQCDKEGEFFTKAFDDIQTTEMEILYLSAIALGTAFIVTLLMGIVATILIWCMVIILTLGTLTLTGLSWYMWYLKFNIAEVDRTEEDKKALQQRMIVAICVTVVTFIILLLLLIMRKRIQLVAQLFREAARVIRAMPLLVFQPLWSLIALVIFLAGLLFVFSYIMTAGDPVIDGSTGYVSFKAGDLIYWMRWYYLLGILWWIQFIFACEQMVIAGAVVQWFFTRDKSKLGCPICRSLWNLIRYHLGTVLFGSFIIALVQLARIVLAYIDRMLRGKSNKLVKFFLKCLACVLWCFEKFLKFVNKNAYIMTAIHGHNFCKGAWAAFQVIVGNALRILAINSVGAFCLFVGKLGVVAITVVIGSEFFIRNKQDICYVMAPLVVVAVVAFVIAHCFLSVYSMVIDTIFIAFCEDCKYNDGVEKPYYMSKGLMEFVENSSKSS